jgi:hypothetical protein
MERKRLWWPSSPGAEVATLLEMMGGGSLQGLRPASGIPILAPGEEIDGLPK